MAFVAKSRKDLRTVGANRMMLWGSFVPNGTSNPTSYTGHFGSSTAGAMTVTYNSATGKWLITINVAVTAIEAVVVQAVDNAAQTVSFEVRPALWTNSAQTIEVWGQTSTDVSATNYAATNTIDRVTVFIGVTTSGVT